MSMQALSGSSAHIIIIIFLLLLLLLNLAIKDPEMGLKLLKMEKAGKAKLHDVHERRRPWDGQVV